MELDVTVNAEDTALCRARKRSALNVQISPIGRCAVQIIPYTTMAP